MLITDREFLRKRDRVVRDLMRLFDSLGIDKGFLNELYSCKRVSEFKDCLTKVLNSIDARGLIEDRDSFASDLNKILTRILLKAVFINDKWIIFYRGRGKGSRAYGRIRIVVSVISGGIAGFFYLGLFLLFLEVYDFPGFIKYCTWIAFAYNSFWTIGYFIGLREWTTGKYSVKQYIVNTLYILALNIVLAMVFSLLYRENPSYLLYAVIYLGLAILPFKPRQERGEAPPPIFIPIPV